MLHKSRYLHNYFQASFHLFYKHETPWNTEDSSLISMDFEVLRALVEKTLLLENLNVSVSNSVKTWQDVGALRCAVGLSRRLLCTGSSSTNSHDWGLNSRYRAEHVAKQTNPFYSIWFILYWILLRCCLTVNCSWIEITSILTTVSQ